MKQIKMGALFLDDVAQTNPQEPTYDGDIPRYDGTSTITIADVPENCPDTDTIITWNIIPNMDAWSRTGILLIADRVLLCNVSWDDLAAAGFVDGVEVVLKGKKYRCHLLSVGEKFNSQNAWDDALDRTRDDNEIWHWAEMNFWGGNEVTHSGRSAVCGFYSAYSWDWHDSSYRGASLGFRPALEPLEPDNLDDCDGNAEIIGVDDNPNDTDVMDCDSKAADADNSDNHNDHAESSLGLIGVDDDPYGVNAKVAELSAVTKPQIKIVVDEGCEAEVYVSGFKVDPDVEIIFPYHPSPNHPLNQYIRAIRASENFHAATWEFGRIPGQDDFEEDGDERDEGCWDD